MTHTVDEVSDLLDIPRPTLYRYLREYSIPHLRRSGKIYVPEESFDRIKEVRELHKEGLGTESVHRRLRGESSLDVEGIEERLDRLLEVLEGLRGDLKPANEALPAREELLQTILERQELLLSEVSNLTGMIEDFAPTNGRRRKAIPGDLEEETQRQEVSSEQPEEHFEISENYPTVDGPLTETSPELAEPPTAPARHGRRFGVMARRRRRGALAILLLALLTGIALTAHALNSEEGSGVLQEESTQQETTSAPPQEARSGDPEEVSVGDPEPTIPAPAARDRGEPAGYAADGYGDATPQRPSYGGQYRTQYQPQYATPGSLPQGQYDPSQYSDLGGPVVYAPAAQGPVPR